MIRFNLLIIIILFLSPKYGIGNIDKQTTKDSLWAVWINENLSDSLRLQSIAQLSHSYLYSKPDSAFFYSQLRYDFAKSNGLKKHMAAALNHQGTSYAMQSDYPKSLDCYLKSYNIYQEIGYKRGMANALGDIGALYSDQGNFPKMLDYTQRSLKIRKEIGDKEGRAACLINIGNVYAFKGDYSTALDYYQSGIKICEEIGSKRFMANAITNIGNIYSDQGKTAEALESYQKNLKIREEIGDKRGIAAGLLNMGIIYNRQGDFNKALEYFQHSINIFEEIGLKRLLANALDGIGDIYRGQGDYQEALRYYKRSLLIRNEIGDERGIPLSLILIGTVYSKQGESEKAIIECQKGLKTSMELGLLREQVDACECLYSTYKGLGNGNMALVYHEKMVTIQDSLNSEETNTKLQQMEFQKQMLADSVSRAEEERLLQLVHEDEMRKEHQARNIAYGIGFVLLLATVGFYNRWRFVRKSKAAIEKEKDRSDNLLLNILPAEVAEELKLKGKADARDFDMVSVLFTDFVDFTSTASNLSASQLVNEVNYCFETFDNIMEKYRIEKIKTIGDAYMAAGGLPISNSDSVKNSVLAALEMQNFIKNRKAEKDVLNEAAFEMRVGIHTGPVVAGIVGVKKFQYDVWGDTVNTASRVENHCKPGRVNISQVTYEFIKDDPEFTFESRGNIEVKGKGEIDMYFVSLVKESH